MTVAGMTCVFKWSGVAGGTGERWTMSINEAARTCSVGRDVSYLLFGHFHASFGPGGGEAEVTVYDGTGTEATRDREYVVEEKDSYTLVRSTAGAKSVQSLGGLEMQLK